MVKRIKDIKLSDGSILKVVSDAQPVINARYTHKEEKRLDKQEAIISTYERRPIRSNFGKPPVKLNK